MDSQLNGARVARRAELLGGLEGIILGEGFLGLSMDDFAARLRCSKSTLYRLAPSKEELVLAVARHFFARAAERIEAAVAEAAGPTARVAAYLASVGQEMNRGSRAFHEQMASQVLTADLYRNNSHFAASRVRQLINEGVRCGVFQIANVELAGQAVAVLLNAIHVGDFASPVGGTPADVHAEFSRLLLFGLLGPPSPSGRPHQQGVRPAPMVRA
jgi:AcrR family transcriptional regulator